MKALVLLLTAVLLIGATCNVKPEDITRHVITDLNCLAVATPIALELGMVLSGGVNAATIIQVITQALTSGEAQAVLNACSPVLANLGADIGALQNVVTAKVAVEKASETRARVKALRAPK